MGESVQNGGAKHAARPQRPRIGARHWQGALGAMAALLSAIIAHFQVAVQKWTKRDCKQAAAEVHRMAADWNGASLPQVVKEANGAVTKTHALCARVENALSTSPNEDLARNLFEDSIGKAPSPEVAIFEDHWCTMISMAGDSYSDHLMRRTSL